MYGTNSVPKHSFLHRNIKEFIELMQKLENIGSNFIRPSHPVVKNNQQYTKQYDCEHHISCTSDRFQPKDVSKLGKDQNCWDGPKRRVSQNKKEDVHVPLEVGFKFIKLIKTFPRKLSPPEMSVGSGLSIERTQEIETFNNRFGPHIK